MMPRSYRVLLALVTLGCLLGVPATVAQTGTDHPEPTVSPGLTGSRPPSPGIGGNEFSVASSTPWPSLTPTHFHSDDSGSFGNPPDLLEVGECCGGGSNEENRGLCEVDLAGQTSSPSAVLSFEVLQLGGLFGQPGGTFDIQVETYLGNNIEELADYGAPVTATIGTFSTGGLTVGQILSLDATSAVNAAISGSDPALGVRLLATSAPSGAAIVFGNCEIAQGVPALPGVWLALLIVGLCVATAVIMRRRSRSL